MKKISFFVLFLMALVTKSTYATNLNDEIYFEEIPLKQVKTVYEKIKIINFKLNNYLKNIPDPDKPEEFLSKIKMVKPIFIRTMKELGNEQISITYTLDLTYRPYTPQWKKVNDFFPYTICFYNEFIEQYCSDKLIGVTYFMK